MPSDRTDFLRDYYRLLTDDISRNEAIVPKVCTVEVVTVVVALLARWHEGPIYLCVLLAILTCAWAMHSLVNANFWACRSLLMAANVEREFFALDDMDVLLPKAYYAETSRYRFRRIFRGALLFSFSLFLTALALLPMSLHVGTAVMLSTAAVLLASIFVENKNCAKQYAYLVNHAPGRDRAVRT